MNSKHAIFVCSTCASTWQDGKRVGVSGGEKLLVELNLQSENWSHSSNFEIKSVECMSACSHSCVIALRSPDKFTYVFGGLNHHPDSLPAVSAAVLECANLYFEKSDGIVSWQERPQLLKSGIIARIPS